MKKIAVLLCFFLGIGTTVSATIWIEMEPEEVLQRADIIVIGTYDLSEEPERLVEHVFRPYEFKVKKTIKGEPPSPLISGVAMYDVSWVREFQNNGGEFLLFLEKDSYSRYALPVGGPNGMVKLVDGRVPDTHEQALYKKVENRIHKEKLSSSTVIAIIVLAAVIFFMWRRRFRVEDRL